jgi:hypothetical protein
LPSVFNRLPVFFENLPVFGRKTGNGAWGVAKRKSVVGKRAEVRACRRAGLFNGAEPPRARWCARSCATLFTAFATD